MHQRNARSQETFGPVKNTVYPKTKDVFQHANGHFLSSRRTRNPYTDSCLKPLYNGHLFKTATFFCPQGCLCREVQLYSRIHSSLYENKPL